jgi:hypothetical protein
VKRGLVRLDPAELTAEELGRRTRATQEQLRAAGVVAALIYGDVSRSGDIAYLTNLCIYWNEGVLLVPAWGEPAFLSKLSGRVHTWMRATSSVRDLASGPDLARLIGEHVAGLGPGAVGVVDRAWWPCTLLDDVVPRLRGRELRDVGRLVRAERLRPPAPELALLRRAAAVAEAALDMAAAPGLPRAERMARAELAARRAGATDLLVDCDAGPDGAVALQVRAQLLACWGLAARTVPEPPALASAWRAASERLRAGVTRSELRAAAPGWDVDVLSHPDVETRGDHRLPGELDVPARAGAVAALRVSAAGMVAARTFVIDEGGIEPCAS